MDPAAKPVDKPGNPAPAAAPRPGAARPGGSPRPSGHGRRLDHTEEDYCWSAHSESQLEYMQQSWVPGTVLPLQT